MAADADRILGGTGRAPAEVGRRSPGRLTRGARRRSLAIDRPWPVRTLTADCAAAGVFEPVTKDARSHGPGSVRFSVSAGTSVNIHRRFCAWCPISEHGVDPPATPEQACARTPGRRCAGRGRGAAPRGTSPRSMSGRRSRQRPARRPPGRCPARHGSTPPRRPETAALQGPSWSPSSRRGARFCRSCPVPSKVSCR